MSSVISLTLTERLQHIPLKSRHLSLASTKLAMFMKKQDIKAGEEQLQVQAGHKH